MTAREAVRVEAPAPAPSKSRAAAPEAAPAVERDVAPPPVRPVPLLADDDRDDRDGRRGLVSKRDFLAELRGAVCAAADVELARVGRDSAGCPYIQRWFDHYERRSADEVVAALRAFAPHVAATSPRDYVAPVTERVRAAVAQWTRTGEISGLPPGMDRLPPLDGPAGRIAGLFGLGAGRPLPDDSRARMERALGHDFARVRVHADAPGAAAASRVGARAFAIGDDVAFAAGEYRPGEPAGDAVLAHELAHVAQQRRPGSGAEAAPEALERDADVAAEGAVRSVWAGERATARPSLRSGLALRRCSGTQTPPAVAPVSDLVRLEAMTPWQLAQLPESSFAAPSTARSGSGHTLADFRRAWQTVRCVFQHPVITQDPDDRRPLGHPVTDPAQLAAIRSGYERMRRYRDESLAATGGAAGLPVPPAPADVPVRVVTSEQYRIKAYQSVTVLLGPPADIEARVREWWDDPVCGVTRNENPVVTTQEIRAVMLHRTMGGEGGMLFEPEQTIYLTEGVARDLTAQTPEGTDARLTLAHESGHLLGAKSRTKAAFRDRFGEPSYQCYWIAFEEGMTERTTRRVHAGVHGGTGEATTPPPPPTPQARHYENFVLLMDAVAREVGNPVVERAYYDGNVSAAVLSSVQRLFPVYVRSMQNLPAVCRPFIGPPGQPGEPAGAGHSGTP